MGLTQAVTQAPAGELGAAEAEYNRLKEAEHAAFLALEEALSKWRACVRPGLRGVELAGAQAEAALLRQEIPALQEQHQRLLPALHQADLKRSALRRDLATVEDNLRTVLHIVPGPRLSEGAISQAKRENEAEYKRLTGRAYQWK